MSASPGGHVALGAEPLGLTELDIFIAAMKNQRSVKLLGPPPEAMALLQAIPGLTVITEPLRADREPDAVLEFAGGQARVALQFKARAGASAAWQLVRQSKGYRNLPLLLIAGETTAEAREILAEHGVAVLDGLGNAHIELPGLLIHTEGKTPRSQARPTRLAGKAGVVAQALLLRPERGWQVQELAHKTGLSVGLTHRVLSRLTDEGLVVAEGIGPRRIRRVADPTALLDVWAEENVDRPNRSRAFLLAQSPRQLITQLSTSLDRNGIPHAVTGAAAASVVAPFITAVPVAEVWVTASATGDQLYDAVGADAVTEGHNVLFLQAKDDTPLAFREQADDLWVANRFRIYCDLRHDPRRGREQADHLRQEVIGF